MCLVRKAVPPACIGRHPQAARKSVVAAFPGRRRIPSCAGSRPHQGLQQRIPAPNPTEMRAAAAEAVASPVLRDLHHDCRRASGARTGLALALETRVSPTNPIPAPSLQHGPAFELRSTADATPSMIPLLAIVISRLLRAEAFLLGVANAVGVHPVRGRASGSVPGLRGLGRGRSSGRRGGCAGG